MVKGNTYVPVVPKNKGKFRMTRTLPCVHELVVMRIEGRQLVERVVLHGHRIIRIRAGRTVVPREEDGGPPIVEARD